MSQSTRTFQYEDDKSSKFWEVTQTDTTVVVRFGKTGTQGQSQEKSFADAAAAAKHAAKLIGEKTAKGYLERGAHSPGSAPSGNAASEPETQPAPATKAAQPSKTAKPTKPKNPAQDPDATHESLLALLDKDELTNRLLAKHPKASAELLEKLSHSSDKVTRQAVALNPSADKEVLARLAPQFPGDFFKNPAFDWLLLEDPDLLLRMGRGVMKNILKRPDCPPSFMKWALEHGSQPEQMAVAMNPAAPADIVAALARRKGGAGDSARGRAEVGAKKAQAAAEAVDPDAVFRAEVRKALGAVEPDEVVSAWKRDMVAGVHWPWLSLDCRLKVKDIPLAVVVAGCLKGREHELGDFPHPEVRALVGLFVEGDYALLTRLAADPSPKVRAAVAANLHCPAASFESLCQDKNPTVRAHAAVTDRHIGATR